MEPPPRRRDGAKATTRSSSHTPTPGFIFTRPYRHPTTPSPHRPLCSSTIPRVTPAVTPENSMPRNGHGAHSTTSSTLSILTNHPWWS